MAGFGVGYSQDLVWLILSINRSFVLFRCWVTYLLITVNYSIPFSDDIWFKIGGFSKIYIHIWCFGSFKLFYTAYIILFSGISCWINYVCLWNGSFPFGMIYSFCKIIFMNLFILILLCVVCLLLIIHDNV